MMMESDRIAISYERKKRIWRALGLRFKNINVVKTLIRMLSEHMHQLVKSMVKRNIWKNNILTRVFAKLENSRSSLTVNIARRRTREREATDILLWCHRRKHTHTHAHTHTVFPAGRGDESWRRRRHRRTKRLPFSVPNRKIITIQ